MNKRKFYTKYDAGKTFCFAIFAPYIFAFILVVIAMISAKYSNVAYDELIKKPVFLAFSVIISPLAFLCVYFLINKKAKIDYKIASKIDFKVSFLNVILCIMIAFCCVFGFNNIVSMFDALINKLGVKQSTDLPLPLNNGFWLAFNIFALALLPAIAEELIFRGVIFNGFSVYGKRKAIIYSAFLFALMHSSISQTVYPILAGSVFALVVSKTDNILYSMIIHFCNNCIVVVNSYIVQVKNIEVQAYELSFINILLSVMFAVLASFVIFAIVKFLLKPSKKEEKIDLPEIDKSEISEISKTSNKYLYVGVICGIIFWITSLFV